MTAILHEDPPDPRRQRDGRAGCAARASAVSGEASAGTIRVGARSGVRAGVRSRQQQRVGRAALPPLRDRRWLVGAVAAVTLGACPRRRSAQTQSAVRRPHPTRRTGPVSPPDVRQGHDPRRAVHTRRTVDHLWRRVERPAAQAVHGSHREPGIRPAVVARCTVVVDSKRGELAISLGHTFEGWMGEGTLARSSLLGSAPRVMAEHVREAEWTPDGSDLAVVRRVEASSDWNSRSAKSCIKRPVSSATFASRQRAIASLLPIIRCIRRCRTDRVVDRRPPHGTVGRRLDFPPRACVDQGRNGSGLVEPGAWTSTRPASMR